MKPILFALFFVLPFQAVAKDVFYELNLDYQTVNVTGKNVKIIALTKNGDAPGVRAPTLEFTEGDVARITVHNHLNEESSIHWHGILVPNDQDGVPGVTNPAINAHSSFTYQFPIIQNGTYWYHSHSGLQEQRGVYGAIVIHPQLETLKYDYEKVVLLSDWTNRKPDQIMNNLKTDPDYEAICKGIHRGWIDDIQQGTVQKRIAVEKSRMGLMDVADVCYDAFLINGRKDAVLEHAVPGQRIRLRIINASSSTYFHVAFGKQPLEIVAADGKNVAPIKVSDFQIAIAETYDVIVTIPSDKSVELRATSADATGHASVIIGKGPLEKPADDPKPDPYAMSMPPTSSAPDHGCPPSAPWDDNMKMCMPKKAQISSSANVTNMIQLNAPTSLAKANDEPGCSPGEPGCDEIFPFAYNMLRSPENTTLPNTCTNEIKLVLTGNMVTYAWSFDNRLMGDADDIEIQKNTNVRMTFVNTTMMHHPLHIHGHFFRLLNGQGNFSPLKHTVDVAPMTTVTIEFFADKDKKWLFHCHNLYHMTAGMGRVVKYAEPGKVYQTDNKCVSPANFPHMATSDFPDAPSSSMDMNHDMGGMGGMGQSMKDMSGKQWYTSAHVGASNARLDAEFKAVNDKYNLSLASETSYDGSDYELRAEATRNLNINWKAGIGAQKDNGGAAARALVQYRMPFLVDTTLGLGNRGVDYSIAKEFALKNNLSLDTKVGREYGVTKYNAFLKWRWKRRLTIMAGPSERSRMEIGVDFRK